MVQRVLLLIKLEALLSSLLGAGKVPPQPQLIPQQHAGGSWPDILQKQAFLGVGLFC